MAKKNDIKEQMPLSESQMGIYFECAENGEAMQYNITFEYEYGLETDAERLAEACSRVLGHYAAFVSGVKVEEGSPMLVSSGEAPKAELWEGTEAEYEEKKSGFARPFAFDGSPLSRGAVCRTERAVYMLTDFHHLIYDGVSTNIFERALDKAYRGEVLEKEEHTIYDAGRAKRERAGEARQGLEYFDALLDGIDTDSNLLPDKEGADMGHSRSLHLGMGLQPEVAKAFAKGLGTTENVVLLSAFSYALAKYTGQQETLFASIESGRRGLPLENTIGFFVRTFPLYFQIDEGQETGEYIEQVRGRYVETMRHDEAGFAELSARYGIRSDVKYVYQGNLINDCSLEGRPVEKRLQDCDDALSNMDVMISRAEEDYEVRIDYRDALYTEGNIRGFARLFATVAKAMVEGGAHKRLGELALTTEEELRQWGQFNATERPYDRAATVWDLLKRNIAATPEKAAVQYKDITISYADSKVATYASFGFDAGIMDIFTTLMAGATLCVVPDEIRLDMPRLNDFYKTHHITHGFITTQVGRMFAEMTDSTALKTLLVGGEKLVPFDPPKEFAFVNGYGPSETIAYVCHHRVTDASSIQPIGIPSGNTKLYVADRMFVSLWIAGINIHTGVGRFASCGHTPPLILHNDGVVECLETHPNMLLGLFEDAEYTTYPIHLEASDVLVAFTDGLTDAANPAGVQLGYSGLLDRMQELDSPPAGCCEYIVRKVDESAADAVKIDDMTVLTVRFSDIQNVTAYSLSLDATSVSHTQLIDRTNASLVEHHCPDDVRRNIDVVIDEMVTNIIEYAYPDGGGRFDVQVEIGDNYAEMFFTDNGVRFNPLEADEPHIEGEPNIGGLGIYMTVNMMDVLEYSRSQDANHLRLWKL